MSKPIDIDSGNVPTIGKRVLYFTALEGGGVQKWPAVILDNYNSTKRDVNGQLVCLIEVHTRENSFVIDAHREPARQVGSFDFYKDADLRV